MKTKRESPTEKPLTEVTKTEAKGLAKTHRINLRITEAEHGDIIETAKSLHLTATEYLLKAHQLVASKLAEK